MIRSSVCVAFLLAVVSPTAALAQSADPWAFELGATTDNRSKDASKSGGDPAVWGLAEWSTDDGAFYAGPAFETIKSSTGSELEVSLFAGIRHDLAGFELDLNAEHKWHVDADPGADATTWEFTANLSRDIGPLGTRLQLQHSPDGSGSTRAWTWVEGRLGWDLTDRLEVTAAVGRREQDGAPDYTGWNAGLTYAMTRSLELDLRWHATDAEIAGAQYEDALVASVAVAF